MIAFFKNIIEKSRFVVLSFRVRNEREISSGIIEISSVVEMIFRRFTQLFRRFKRESLLQSEGDFSSHTRRNDSFWFAFPATLFLFGISNSVKAQQDSNHLSISELGPILEPDPVQFSFQTPGWYFLLAIIFLLVCFFIIKWFLHYRKNAYRREALKNLSLIETRFNAENDISCLTDVLVLLKLVGMQSFQREKVARLHGTEWLQFLEEKGKETPFQKYSETISAALYNAGEVEKNEVRQIMEITKKWIKTHA